MRIFALRPFPVCFTSAKIRHPGQEQARGTPRGASGSALSAHKCAAGTAGAPWVVLHAIEAPLTNVGSLPEYSVAVIFQHAAGTMMVRVQMMDPVL